MISHSLVSYRKRESVDLHPVGTKRRLRNPGERPLLLVETQSRSYLGEEDIEQFKNRYNRT